MSELGIEVTSSELLPMSKREAMAIIHLVNNSERLVAVIKLKSASIGGMSLIIADSDPLHDLKPHEKAEIEAQVILPKNMPIIFESDSLDEAQLTAEFSFDVSHNMTKESFDALPEWRPA